MFQIQPTQPTLKSSATMTISPAPAPPVKEQTELSETTSEELKDKPRLVIKKKVSPPKSDEKSEKLEETKVFSVQFYVHGYTLKTRYHDLHQNPPSSHFCSIKIKRNL